MGSESDDMIIEDVDESFLNIKEVCLKLFNKTNKSNGYFIKDQ